jgi:hypothetical protein
MITGRNAGWLLSLLLASIVSLSACGLRSQPQPPDQTHGDFDGVWQGMTVNDCSAVQVDPSRCRAVQKISFTLLQQNKKSWGFYGCAPATTPCYDHVDHGEIKDLQLHGRRLWLRVMRNDHSSCLFSTIPSGDRMVGGFWCFQGSALVERGYWQVECVY